MSSALVLPFSSVSKFLAEEIPKAYKSEPDNRGSVIIAIESAAENLLDLYTIGRLLAICRLLKSFEFSEVVVDFAQVQARRASNLAALGLFDFLNADGTPAINTKIQMQLLKGIGSLGTKTYWKCLVPLQKIIIQGAVDETLALSSTHDILGKISEIMMVSLGNLDISATQLVRELHKILFGILRELILNVIVHSESRELVLALAVDRETSTSSRPHHPGLVLEAGQDKFHFLALDFGRGLLTSVQQQLAAHLQPLPEELTSYNSPAVLNNSLARLRQKEATLLNSVFHGNLVIRKGRKSEGLHDVGNKIAWFGGILNYRTGRTELEIRHGESRGYGRDIRSEPQRAHYLPGVMAGGILPSHSLKVLTVKRSMDDTNLTHLIHGLPKIDAFTNLPKGLFGGRTVTEIRRRCELYAREFIEEYAHNSVHISSPFFMFVDLGNSNNISVPFLDTLLQELCKGVDPMTSINPLKRIFFLNCPRSIIQALKERTCTSFLKLLDTFCLLLDEDDAPHFLGVPRVSKSVFDVEETMIAAFLHRKVPASWLKSDWKFSDEMLGEIKKYFSNDEKDMFFIQASASSFTFYGHRLLEAVAAWRKNRVSESIALARSRLPGFSDPAEGVNELLNIVSEDYVALREIAGMLVRQADLPPVNNVIAFIENGHRLAAEIHTMIDASKLIVLDSDAKQKWQSFVNVVEGPTMIAVDRLDENISQKYIEPFLNHCEIPVYAICCILDARKNRADYILQSKVSSLFTTEGLLPYINVALEKDGKEPSSNQDKPEEEGSKQGSIFTPSYDVELSAEFWHNVSTLKILSSRELSRDKRTAIFYEHNERIIENRRTRRFLEEFAVEFIRDRLRLDVDVVIHPNHPVGAFLAHLAARLLNTPPLVIPIKQTQYGGKLEVSEHDFAEVRQLVMQHLAALRRINLNVLLLDDSIFTGSSIFSMIGFAESLGLRIKGILVLLNRLPIQISDGLSSLQYPFGYLYRLHMPLTSGTQSPDVLLRQWSEMLLEKGYSFYLYDWCHRMPRDQGASYLFGAQHRISPDQPLVVEGNLFQNETVICPKPHEIKQIIQGLILHPDAHILSFETRVAVTYNFMERLVIEPAYWKLLLRLLDTAAHTTVESNEAQFVRKLLLLMAASTLAKKPGLYAEIEKVCCKALGQFLTTDWVTFKGIISDAFLALGLLGSGRLFDYFDGVATILTKGLKSKDAILRGAAQEIAASFSWSLSSRILLLGKEPDNSQTSAIKSCFQKLDLNEDLHIAMLDLISPYLLHCESVRAVLGVHVWTDQEKLLDCLQGGDKEITTYLVEAPGYSFTLTSLLMLCRATTVLLFARNEADEHFYLRMYQTKGGIKASDQLSINDLRNDTFRSEVQEKMDRGMFFASSHFHDLKIMNNYRHGQAHTHVVGKEIRVSAGTTRYYLLLGYSADQDWDPRFLRTSFLYLLRATAVLRQILPAIHEKHIVSATAWNTLMQAISPVHPIRNRNRPRRIQLQHAMSQINFVELLRKAVDMSRQAPMMQMDIFNKINEVQTSLRNQLVEANRFRIVASADVIPTTSKDWPVYYMTRRHDLPSEEQYYSFPSTIFEFVLYECLCNALAYYKSNIEITVAFGPDSVEGDSSYTMINLLISNDSLKAEQSHDVSGITACATAAAAVGGTFHSAFDKDDKKWKAILKLKAMKVPEQLTQYLHDYLP